MNTSSTPSSPDETTSPSAANWFENGFGIASVAVGLAGIIVAFIPLITYGSGPLALVGVALAVMGLVRRKPRAIAFTGMVTSTVAWVVFVVIVVASVVASLTAGSPDNGLETPAVENQVDTSAAESGNYEPGTRQNPAALTAVIATHIGTEP